MKYEQYKLYGPYKRKDGRLIVILVHKITKEKTTVSYPKYVYETHYNITINTGYDVHHKDENPLNNEISNLELMEKSRHNRMHGLKQSSKYEEIKKVKCVMCGIDFFMDKNQLRHRASAEKKGKHGPFCSKSCTGKYGTDVQNYPLIMKS